MSLTIPSTGATIYASDIDQLVYVLQQQSGGQEKHKYFLGNALYTNGSVASLYTPTLSQNSTPASSTVDQADQAGSGGMSTSSSVNHLSSSGYQVYTFSGNTSGPNAIAGGNVTVNY